MRRKEIPNTCSNVTFFSQDSQADLCYSQNSLDLRNTIEEIATVDFFLSPVLHASCSMVN